MHKGWWWAVQTLISKVLTHACGCDQSTSCARESRSRRVVDLAEESQLQSPAKLQKCTVDIIKAANRALVASREPGTEPADWEFFNAAEVTTMSPCKDASQ